MIYKVPFIKSDHQVLQTNHIQNVLDDPTSFWSKNYLTKCQEWFLLNFKRPIHFLDSCTEAVHGVSLIAGLQPEDEVIAPSFTHVSTILAFANRGIKPVFVDIAKDNLCIDPEEVKKGITDKTRMIIAVNYGGWSPDYDALTKICSEHDLLLMEDNAHGLGASSSGKALGSFGDFSVFSFERQKNVSCQEGGGLIIHNDSFNALAAEVINLGTNREAFDAGESDFFEWTSAGIKSSFTEFQAAYLLPQLESLEKLTTERRNSWVYYYENLKDLNRGVVGPELPFEAHNGHVFYLILVNQEQRDALKTSLAAKGIEAHPHYYPLHLSKYGSNFGSTVGDMSNTLLAGRHLLRLPMFNGISNEEQDFVIDAIYSFFDA